MGSGQTWPLLPSLRMTTERFWKEVGASGGGLTFPLTVVTRGTRVPALHLALGGPERITGGWRASTSWGGGAHKHLQ